MIDFPVTLHEIEKFQINDQYYVVDLDQNELILIDRIVWDVLELCTSNSRDEIIAHLGKQYTEAEIFEAFNCIGQFAELGVLVSKMASRSPINGQKLHILTFINQKPTAQSGDISGNWSDYLLLESLSRNMEVTIGIPENQWDESHSNDATFHLIPIQTGLTYAQSYYIDATDADIVVAFPSVDFDQLSVGASTVLPLFSFNNIPTIIRIHSGVKNEDVFINSVLAVYAAKRLFDVIVVDAPWIIHGVQDILSTDIDVTFLPDPVDLERFKPYDEKMIGKRCINSVFDAQEALQKPVVGIMAGQVPEVNYHIGQFMAQVCPELFFFVFAPKLPNFYLHNLPSNLIFYTETEHIDADARLTPMLLNAMDVCFFQATLQNSSSLLSQSLACSVPTLIGSNYPMPEFENACAFIHSRKEIIHQEYLELILDTLKQLLLDRSKLEQLSRKGRKLAENFSLNAISEQFTSLVSSLSTRQPLESQEIFTPHPTQNLFHYSYHPDSGTVQSQTILLPSRTPATIEKGLAKELLKFHTPLEVKTLLTQISSDDGEEACRLLDSLSGSIL